MTVPEKAVAWAKQIAADDSHGYDQNARWGPDYDCSSLVISAYKHAGLPLTSTYTGNMRNDFFNNGFAVAQGVNLATGAGLRLGDVLLNEIHHTALYIGDGKILHASGNEFGGATGGRTGDQTGKEISICNYFNFPWDYVLRYVRKDEPEPAPAPAPEPVPDTPTAGEYIVQSGDSLWAIAVKLFGDGSRYTDIMKTNGLTSVIIYPGQKLKIPGTSGVVLSATVKPETYQLLQIMADGNHMTLGQVIDLLLSDAV